jgi:hypothetical protein
MPRHNAELRDGLLHQFSALVQFGLKINLCVGVCSLLSTFPLDAFAQVGYGSPDLLGLKLASSESTLLFRMPGAEAWTIAFQTLKQRVKNLGQVRTQNVVFNGGCELPTVSGVF